MQLDYVSGLLETQSGDVGFIVAVDCYTGFVMAQPVRAMTASVSVRFLVDFVILQYGLPRAVQTDNGTHFAGSFEEACNKLKIQLHKSTPYFPRSHGKIERVHRLILDRMRRSGETELRPRLLPYAVFAVNSRRVLVKGSKDDSTSPLELLTGVRARNEAEATVVSLFGEPSMPEDPHPRLAHLGALRDEWSKNGESGAVISRPVERRDIQVGDSVLVWSEKGKIGKGQKLDHCWMGPAMLVWKGTRGGCAVFFPESGKRLVIHISRIKKYWQ